jgi:chromosome segregation ATPase
MKEQIQQTPALQNQQDQWQQQQWQQQQIQRLQQEAQERAKRQNPSKEKKSPAVVTRVVADLMVFVEVTEPDGSLGLVFKPNKIDDYHGELLQDLNIVVGAHIPEVVWNSETLKVVSVSIERTRDTPLNFASA